MMVTASARLGLEWHAPSACTITYLHLIWQWAIQCHIPEKNKNKKNTCTNVFVDKKVGYYYYATYELCLYQPRASSGEML